MTQNRKQAILIFSAILLFVLIFSALFLFVDLPKIIESVGIKNGYVFVFLFALIGGVSSFTSASFYATVAFFASGGLNPFLLALSAAPALAIGDYVFYFLGHEGRLASGGGFKNFIEKLTAWFQKKPRKFFPLFIFIYGGLTPLPADILMFSLALVDFPFKKALPFILLGHITFLSLLSLGAFAIFG
jgi:hypothetical protein